MELSQEAKEYIKQYKEDLKKNNLNNIFGVRFSDTFNSSTSAFRQEVVDAFFDSGIDIFKYLTHIHTSAFRGLVLPTTIVLPEAHSIDRNAFSKTNIEKISCPKCDFIGLSAFKNCKNLEEVKLPNASTICPRAFSNTSIKKLHLSNVEYIQNIDGAFGGCEKLEILYLPNLNNDKSFFPPEEIIRYIFFGSDAKTSADFKKFEALRYLSLGGRIAPFGKTTKEFIRKYFPNVTIERSATGKILYP